MGKYAKLLEKILHTNAYQNIDFALLCQLLWRLGFVMRVKGDHHIFAQPGVVEIINLQPKGHQAKPYQVKQVRAIILKYKLYEQDCDD